MANRRGCVRARATWCGPSGPSEPEFFEPSKPSKRVRTLPDTKFGDTLPEPKLEPITICSLDGSRISLEYLPELDVCGTKLHIRTTFDTRDTILGDVDYLLGDEQFFVPLNSIVRLAKQKSGDDAKSDAFDVVMQLSSGQLYVFCFASREAATAFLQDLSETVTKGLKGL